MGKIENGILGGFSGTVGTVVGAKWMGIDTMRSKPEPRKTPFTPAELVQQQRFALASTFMTPMRELLAKGFKQFAIKKMGLNAAVGYAMKNAVMPEDEGYSLLCEHVLVCRGDLPPATEAIAVSDKTDQVTFHWTDDASGRGKALAADSSILVVLCPALKTCVYTFAGAPRSAGTDTLHVHHFNGQEVMTWLSFQSVDKKDVASSIFTGQLTMP